jgi:hypothetical protein
MRKPVFGWLLAIFLALGLAFFSTQLTPVHAATPTPQAATPTATPLPTSSGPDRYTSMTVDITLTEWWLAAWANNQVRCSFFTDHAGLPTDNDVYSACGAQTFNEWKARSIPCAEKETSACNGLYFIQIGSKPGTREVTVKLPPPQVWVSIEDCQLDENNWCITQPSLVLTAIEPLPNETITAIEGYVGADPFHCAGSRCVFKLADTRSQGLRLNFWAVSTYGDQSQVFDALLRVINDGGQAERLTDRWYVDVLSSQWQGAPLASCSTAWEAFPPPEGLPQWLSTPASEAGLRSQIPYAYLAANLITQGIVEADTCPNGGLLPDGSANACGMEAAQPAVLEWQNRFDRLILTVAGETQVPAQLLKNLFSRESQFWPGVFRFGADAGLGQLTSDGADTALLWNPSFYHQFCPLVLDQNLCQKNGFANLNQAHQELLRGALVASVDARCADCPLGLDLSRADFSVGVFARTLLANCEQAGKIVQNVSGKAPGLTTDYETLWRLTLVNYNAGPGCLVEAVRQAYQPENEIPLNWERVAASLDEACRGVVPYVEDLTREVEPSSAPPLPTPTAQPTLQPSDLNGQ